MEKITYQQLFEDHREKVWRFALRLMEDRLQAEDVLQDLLVKCWKHEKELQTMENPQAWLMRVTRNLCIDRIRKRNRMKVVDLENATETMSETANPAKTIMISDLMDRLKQLLEAFPEKQKMVFHLREIEGMAYQEISDILEMSLADVKVNLHRARKKIQQQLIMVDSYGLS